MQINEKTGKPLGYHQKGKLTLTEFCVQKDLKWAIALRASWFRSLQEDQEHLDELREIPKDYPTAISELEDNIRNCQAQIDKYNEKILFYSWMLH